MGSVIKRQYTVKGKARTSRRYYVRYQDGAGRWRVEAAFTDKRASEARLAEREAEAARGIVHVGDPYAEHRQRALKEHAADFVTHLAAEGVTEDHRVNVGQYLNRAFLDMGATYYADVTTTKVEGHLLRLVEGRLTTDTDKETATPRAAKTRNHVRNALAQFFAWSVRMGRWPTNPVEPISRLNAVATPKRKRRALAVEELHRLLQAAKARPLAQYIAGNHANPTPEKRAELELLGLQRAALYQTAAMTGLRRGELRQLRWADLDLDAETATVTVRAETAKARRADTLPLTPPVAQALREWRQAWAGANWRVPGQGEAVFNCIGRQTVEHFRADCAHGGIEDTAEGRVDFHSLRHTTATFLCQAGVSVRTAQAIMRHVDPRTTMRVYAHVQGADRLDAVARLADLTAPKATDTNVRSVQA